MASPGLRVQARERNKGNGLLKPRDAQAGSERGAARPIRPPSWRLGDERLGRPRARSVSSGGSGWKAGRAREHQARASYTRSTPLGRNAPLR